MPGRIPRPSAFGQPATMRQSPPCGSQSTIGGSPADHAHAVPEECAECTVPDGSVGSSARARPEGASDLACSQRRHAIRTRRAAMVISHPIIDTARKRGPSTARCTSSDEDGVPCVGVPCVGETEIGDAEHACASVDVTTTAPRARAGDSCMCPARADLAPPSQPSRRFPMRALMPHAPTTGRAPARIVRDPATQRAPAA